MSASDTKVNPPSINEGLKIPRKDRRDQHHPDRGTGLPVHFRRAVHEPGSTIRSTTPARCFRTASAPVTCCGVQPMPRRVQLILPAPLLGRSKTIKVRSNGRPVIIIGDSKAPGSLKQRYPLAEVIG